VKPWEMDEIRRATKAKWLARGSAAVPFNGHVCTDSRKAAVGDLFVAIKGARFDAHDYVRQVIEAGVAGVIVHTEPAAEIVALAQQKSVAILLVDETVAALNRLAAAYRAELRAKVIAVGGSNGKTTTKRIIHTLLSQKLSGHSSPKSYNNNIGMPLTLLEVEANHEFVVLEIGTNAPGEIAALGEVARPDIAVITNIGLEHLEKLGDLEGVAREEASIAPFVREDGTLVLPTEAPELMKSLRLTKAQRITVGRPGTEADLAATDVVENIDGTRFTLNGRATFALPLLGGHNALNALLAIAVARRLGLSDEQIQAGLLEVKPAPMRLEPVRIGGHFVINDAYNANPSSMAAAIGLFGRLSLPVETRRRVAILGDMLELGEAGDIMHREVGARVAAGKIDLLVAVGKAMQHAADTALQAGVEVQRFGSTAHACQHIHEIIVPGDALLLKGSRGMAMETILESLSKRIVMAQAPLFQAT